MWSGELGMKKEFWVYWISRHCRNFFFVWSRENYLRSFSSADQNFFKIYSYLLLNMIVYIFQWIINVSNFLWTTPNKIHLFLVKFGSFDARFVSPHSSAIPTHHLPMFAPVFFRVLVNSRMSWQCIIILATLVFLTHKFRLNLSNSLILFTFDWDFLI